MGFSLRPSSSIQSGHNTSSYRTNLKCRTYPREGGHFRRSLSRFPRIPRDTDLTKCSVGRLSLESLLGRHLFHRSRRRPMAPNGAHIPPSDLISSSFQGFGRAHFETDERGEKEKNLPLFFHGQIGLRLRIGLNGYHVLLYLSSPQARSNVNSEFSHPSCPQTQKIKNPFAPLSVPIFGG